MDAVAASIASLAPCLARFAVAATALLLAWPRLSAAPLWRASITPLASIIGSGFLVLGPILDTAYGRYAPLAMILLCVVAYGYGHAIRANIRTIEAQNSRSPLAIQLDTFASWVLAFALYYALQALIAAVDETGGRKSFFRFSFFAGLAVLGLVMTLFGESIE